MVIVRKRIRDVCCIIRPSSQDFCGSFDISFSIISVVAGEYLRSFANCKELLQLTSIVFIWGRLLVRCTVEVTKHRRVKGYVLDKSTEVAECIHSQHLILLEHVARVFNGICSARKVIHPKQRHLLANRDGLVYHHRKEPRLQERQTLIVKLV